MSSYNICFFITKDGGENFDIAGLQTDNILNIETETFIKKEVKEIIKAKFKAKNRTMFETGISKDFNGCYMTIEAESIMVI